MLPGFDVAMDDAADVGDAERAGDIEPDAADLPRGEPAATPQPRREVLAVDELHDQVGLVAVGARVQAGDDVRVAEDGGGQRLAPEALGEVGVGGDLGAQQLDRDRPLGAYVDGPMDRRHPAATDDRPEPVAPAEEPHRAAATRAASGSVGWRGHAATIAETARTGPRLEAERPGDRASRRPDSGA